MNQRSGGAYRIITVTSFVVAAVLLGWAAFIAYSWVSSPTLALASLPSIAGNSQAECTEVVTDGQEAPETSTIGNANLTVEGERWSYSSEGEVLAEGTFRIADDVLEADWRDSSGDDHQVRITGLSAITLDAGNPVTLRQTYTDTDFNQESSYEVTLDLAARTLTYTTTDTYDGGSDEEVITCQLV